MVTKPFDHLITLYHTRLRSYRSTWLQATIVLCAISKLVAGRRPSSVTDVRGGIIVFVTRVRFFTFD